MKPQSAKAKGRNLQKWTASKLIEYGLSIEGDIESRPMGSGGEDVIMGVYTRERFPYSIECKNVEKLNFWKAYFQAVENAGDHEPLVIIKRNGQKPLALVDAEHFMEIRRQLCQN